MKKIIFLFSIVTCLTIATSLSAQSTNQQVADEIMTIVKAQWATEIAEPTNITKQLENIADDYTEFNPDYSTRIDGKSTAVRLTEAVSKDPGRSLAAEMLNPKVQVYGDVAILTYNFAGVIKNKDGEVKPTRAKSTRVYAKIAGKWKMVHANFASDPLPAN